MSSEAAVRLWLVRVLQGFYSPRPQGNVTTWAEGPDGIRLRPDESIDFHGAYSTEMTPYVRFIQEFSTGQFSENIEFLPGYENQEWDEFVQMKSSQTGYTLAVLVIIAFFVAVEKKNVLYSIDSREEARRISKKRLQPMLQDCAATRSAISENEDDLSNLTLFLMGLTVWLIGGHSTGAFANKSAGLIVVDEADEHPCPDPNMPTNVDLARDRGKAVASSKFIILSKPSQETGIIFKEFQTGTRHKCFVPCPHCNHFQELVWERVRFDHCKDLAGEYDLQRVKRETFYECEVCHNAIEEKHKPGMLGQHRWRQTNPAPKPGKISAHISDLYSPFAKSTLGTLAVEWREAQSSPTKLSKFFQSRLGLPSRSNTSIRTASDIMALRGGYKRGTCPIRNPFFASASADTQDDVKKWVTGCFARNGDLYITNWGKSAPFDDLHELLDDPIPCAPPIGWKVDHGFDGIDSVRPLVGVIDEGGHLGNDVHKFCLASHGKWWPLKGRGRGQIRGTVIESQRDVQGVPLTAYHFDDPDFKKQLYLLRIGQHKAIREGRKTAPTIYLPDDLEGEFIDELLSEKLVKEKDKYGFTREIWQKDRTIPNDWGDAIKMLLVSWWIMEPFLTAMEKEEAEKTAKEAAANAK